MQKWRNWQFLAERCRWQKKRRLKRRSGQNLQRERKQIFGTARVSRSASASNVYLNVDQVKRSASVVLTV